MLPKPIIFVLALTALWGLTVAGDCYEDPTDPACARFQIPVARIEANIATLCNATGGMPNMAGCSVSPQMTAEMGGVYCTPFSIMSDICYEMPGMNGCQDYNNLCRNGSVVAQCKTPRLSLPAGAQLRNQIIGICSEMSMDGCEQCYPNGKWQACDAFLVYSNLCVAMPEMSQCALWNSYCAAVPTWTICGGDTWNPNTAVEMKMYWHWTFNDYVLFKGWVPRSVGAYVGTLIACVVFAMAYEAFKAYTHWLENKWKVDANAGQVNGNKIEAEPLLSEMTKLEVAPFDPKKDLIRSVLHMIYYGMHYWVMLLAMTFNVGIFFAILVGHFLGYLAFGRFSRLVRVEQSCCT